MDSWWLSTIPKRVSRIIQVGVGIRVSTYSVFQSLDFYEFFGVNYLTPTVRIQQFRSKIFLWLHYMYLMPMLSCCLSMSRITNDDQLANHPTRSPPRLCQQPF